MADHEQIYADQLIESLSDVVDTLNEALADKLQFTFNIQILQKPGEEPRWALTALNATKSVPLPIPPA